MTENTKISCIHNRRKCISDMLEVFCDFLPPVLLYRLGNWVNGCSCMVIGVVLFYGPLKFVTFH